MDTEQRISQLEHEVKILKSEIETTLKELEADLPEKNNLARRWQKNAWVLALLNLLMAVVLFTNLHFYVSGATGPLDLNPVVYAWLRALWLAMAFIWLLLQLYPLALLLEQEDAQWQGVVWRNATALFRVQPGMLVLMTLAILIIAIINTVMPAAWLIIALALLVTIASIALRKMIDLYRARS
jgi:cation transport ATPase